MRLDGTGPVAYRIGWTTNRRWWHPHRPWQAEADGYPLNARRAFTPRGAERKIRRDTAAANRGHRLPLQAWQAWKRRTAPRRCAVLGHRRHRLVVGGWPHMSGKPSKWCARCLADLPELEAAS